MRIGHGICALMHTRSSMRIDAHTCVYVLACVYDLLGMYAYIHSYSSLIYIYIYMYIYIHIHTYIYIYIYI